jgi:hypothetical protein
VFFLKRVVDGGSTTEKLCGSSLGISCWEIRLNYNLN